MSTSRLVWVTFGTVAKILPAEYSVDISVQTAANNNHRDSDETEGDVTVASSEGGRGGLDYDHIYYFCYHSVVASQ